MSPPRRVQRVLLVVLLAASAMGACRAGPAVQPASGQPRHPDAQGVVVEVSVHRIVLDSGAAFGIHPQVQSFTSRGHEVTPLLSWQGRYVHVGIDEDRQAVWIAGIGLVIEGDPPTVVYTGVLQAVSSDRATFEDGTVLRVGSGAVLPAVGSETVVTIDAARHLVIDARRQPYAS